MHTISHLSRSVGTAHVVQLISPTAHLEHDKSDKSWILALIAIVSYRDLY